MSINKSIDEQSNSVSLSAEEIQATTCVDDEKSISTFCSSFVDILETATENYVLGYN